MAHRQGDGRRTACRAVHDAFVAFATAFAVVFVAEFADKTQLVLLALAARGRPRQVWLGAVAAFFLLSALAAAVGGLLAKFIPATAVALGGGALFILFGVLALRHHGPEDAPEPRATGFLPAFTLTLVAELGDKSQLATAALAAQGNPVMVGLGAFLALAATALVAALAGTWVGRHVPERALRLVGGVLFLVLGALLMASPWLPVI